MTYWTNSFKLFTHEVCVESFDSEVNIYMFIEKENKVNGTLEWWLNSYINGEVAKVWWGQVKDLLKTSTSSNDLLGIINGISLLKLSQ